MSHHAAKLTAAQVLEIRALLATGESSNAIGQRYGVCGSAIRKIRSGRNWKNLEARRRTHCHRGHAYAEHAYVDARSRHRCRPCARVNEASRRPTRAQYLAEHDGHKMITNSAGALRCITCWRGEDYIDEIAVDRAVAGDRPKFLTVAERAAAIDRLLDTGMSQLAAAGRLKISDRTVQRRAAELRKAAA